MYMYIKHLRNQFRGQYARFSMIRLFIRHSTHGHTQLATQYEDLGFFLINFVY